jgi:hypothetical protein
MTAALLMSFFLFLHVSLLLASPKKSYPDLSPAGVSSYVLVMDMSNDGVYSMPEQSRVRSRAEFFVLADLTIKTFAFNQARDYLHAAGSCGFAFGDDRSAAPLLSMVSRK